MYIAPLQQALCANRSQITKGPEPGDWITPSLPNGWRLLSFHFFVNWGHTPPMVANQIWMTRQLKTNFLELANISDDDILSMFCEGASRQEFEDLELACAPCGHKVSAILLPEISASDITDNTPVWVVARREGQEFRIKRITIFLLKQAIQTHSGGPVHVGSKGLTYGTSAVECYLSNSDAAFPGDADALIVDDKNQVHCVVEYKKHTLSSPIGKHLVAEYYPHPDARKYQRLAALAERYGLYLKKRIPLVVLYYSTNTPIIRLQEIGSLDALRVVISRDTGDVSILGQPPKSISDNVVAWLGIL